MPDNLAALSRYRHFSRLVFSEGVLVLGGVLVPGVAGDQFRLSNDQVSLALARSLSSLALPPPSLCPSPTRAHTYSLSPFRLRGFVLSSSHSVSVPPALDPANIAAQCLQLTDWPSSSGLEEG